jgi:hypothetical protein
MRDAQEIDETITTLEVPESLVEWVAVPYMEKLRNTR